MDYSSALQELLGRFSAHGETAEGGITRLLYQPSWLGFQREVACQMEKAGMKAGFDAVGNMIGRIEGTEESRPVVTGSHADTVKNGGQLDGQYGIAAGCLAVQGLLAAHGPPRRSVEVVAFAEEEGSRFPYTFWGSKNYLGQAAMDEVAALRDEDGVSFADAMQQAGFSPFEGTLPGCRPHAYIELHVEQGDLLLRKEARVGAVTGIVAQRRYTAELVGAPNHAGTTQMKYRQDAMTGFVRLCALAMDKAGKVGDPLVLTFGKLLAEPNVPNVIPGRVCFTIDCRHPQNETLRSFTDETVREMAALAGQMGLEFNIRRETDVSAVQMDAAMTQLVADCCEERQIPYRRMMSGAGHDAQIFAPVVPTTMMFVPSTGGISHSPQEHTPPEDLALGVQVLAEALYRLAWAPPA